MPSMLGRLKKVAKELLAIVWIRRSYEAVMRGALELIAANRLTSFVYSILSIPSFNREQFAVLRGRRDYYRNLGRTRRSRTELRRNIHRLEKGLLMRPRRAVFALDYLVETLEFYERAVAASGDAVDTGELAWAHDVLAEYFSVVDGDHPLVASARARFESSKAHYRVDTTDAGGPRKVPYSRLHGTKSATEYEDLLDLARQRRSVRWFQSRRVPRELIDQALLVARESPSACNRLPYEFRIFDDPELVRRVASIPFGTAGYADQIPAVAVVVGRLHHYFSPRDRHVIYVDGALAAMPFMLALETLGLASCVINWPDFEPLERRMQSTLHLAVDERVIMLIAIGYADPDGLVAWSEKKSLDTLRRYNDLGGRRDDASANKGS